MKSKSLFITMFVSLLIFISVTYLFTDQNGFTYDQSVMNWINEVSAPFTLNVMELVSLFGSSEVILLLTALIAGIFLFKKDWYHMILFLIVSVGGVALNFILKMIFQRERPGGEVSHIEVFNFSFDIPSYSFPSGHTMRATILLLFIMYIIHKFASSSRVQITLYIVSGIAMLGVALSRLFLEAHFLSDTVAAMSISVTWFCVCLILFKRFDRNRRSLYHPVIGK